MQLKVGIGYDVHRLVKGRKLYLGGVLIPHSLGLEGHSDADVLLHAICDAILGALGKGDIGEYFPNTNKKYKDLSSVLFLKEVFKLLKAAEYKIGNVDTVVLAEKPNLKKYKPKMRAVMAKVLEIGEGKVNIKATTQEGLGAIGRSEAIAAYAMVVLVKK